MKTINARELDMEQESMIVDFLCSHLYPVIYGVRTSEVLDIDTQLSGTDVILPDGKHDVKAQLKSYIGSSTPTFVMEVGASALKRDPVTKEIKASYPRDGWFIDDSLKTDYYDLVWIHQAQTEGEYSEKHLTSPEGIQKLEMIIVKKSVVREYVRRHVTDKRIKEIVNAMRKRIIGTPYYENGIKFVYSPGYAERPVNIIISKLLYRKLAKYHLMYENGVVKEFKRVAVCPRHHCVYSVSKKRQNSGFSVPKKKQSRVFSASQRR